MLSLGKIPPQNIAFEQAILGALILEKDTILDVIDILKAEVFYKEEHRFIFEAILVLFNEGKPIDSLTVAQQLRITDHLEAVGGAFYLGELTNQVGSSANIVYHSQVVYESFMRRELIRISSEIQNRAFDESEDIFDLINENESLLLEITSFMNTKHVRHIKEVLSDSMDILDETIARREQGLSKGIKTGLIQFDYKLHGFLAGDLNIIAARPGIGKTTLALNFAYNIANLFKEPSLFFSLEMKETDLVNKIISCETEINYNSITEGRLNELEMQIINSKNNEITKAPLYFDDTAKINTMEIRAKIKRAKAKHGIKIVFIDYLQLMGLMRDGNNRVITTRENEVTAMTRQLKVMAKELDVSMVVLCQLSRAVESRAGKRPQLSDLRESGSIEQDADRVIFLCENEGQTEIIIAKNRHGATSEMLMEFKKEYSKFIDSKNENYEKRNADF